MMSQLFSLLIISPDKMIFEGSVSRLTVPGAQGSFEVLAHHAPLISCLQTGTVTYDHDNTLQTLSIKDGFVEVAKNKAIMCIELS